VIIVEGPDGAGKTTLIQQIASHFELPVAPRVVSKEANAMVSLKPWVEKNVSEGFQVTLFDRHRLISEPIYGSILRKTFEPGFDDFAWLYSMYTMFYNAKPLIIYCLPEYETVRANLEGDEDNTAVVHKIRRVYAQYVAKAASDCTQHGAMRYSYTTPLHTLSNIFNAVEKAVERKAHV
jgi:adenylate kinase family enzyme